VFVPIAAFVVALAISLGWRDHWAPALGATVGVAIALLGDAAELGDLVTGLEELWRPMISIVGVMVTTACAAELGVFTRMAAMIEPRTRGPVRGAFRFVFVIAALTAALLSNDAAILLITPIVVELLRAVYPKRHPKFVIPFAFCAFVAAGVAPLPTGNPMNLVLAMRANIGWNEYAVTMIPVAIAGWVVAYFALSWAFKDALADENPALGEAPPKLPLSRHAWLVLGITAASIVSYPLLAAFGLPIWPVAAVSALAGTAVAIHAGVRPTRILGGVSWELLPFLFGVLVLATAIARTGATAQLAAMYAASPAPQATVGVVAAIGSALIDNHPMGLLHSHALANAPHGHVFAALVGGDLGPRLLPIGSLAGLLWTSALRRQGVVVSLGTFVRVGLIVTVPSLAASLVVLWILT